LKNVSVIIDDLVQKLSKAFTDLGLEDKWKVFEEKNKKDNEAKQAEREENYKKWMREYWLTNNMTRSENSQKKIAE